MKQIDMEEKIPNSPPINTYVEPSGCLVFIPALILVALVCYIAA